MQTGFLGSPEAASEAGLGLVGRGFQYDSARKGGFSRFENRFENRSSEYNIPYIGRDLTRI